MFDPYHKWLGIPRSEQPPNHYRLLGISLYESDPEVIEASAERQLHHIGRCASAPHLSLMQQLHRELLAARDCLLIAAAKQAYDAELKARLGCPMDLAEVSDTQPSQMRLTAPVNFQAGSGIDVAFGESPLVSRRGKRRPDRSVLQFITGAVLGGLIIWPSYIGLGRPQLQIRRTEQHLTVDIVRTNQPPVRWNVW